HLYANKNLPELKRVCQLLTMGDDFYALARFGHDMAKLLDTLSNTAKQDTHIVTAVDELQRLKTHLETQWQTPVSIDVTELSGYHYHPGIIFNGYINTETQPLVRGGRFDGMHSVGQLSAKQPRQTTGLSMDVSRLLAHNQPESSTTLLFDYASSQLAYTDKAQMQNLLQQVTSLRQQGYRVTMPLTAGDCPAALTHRLNFVDNEWRLEAV